jgi:hypothetical protein
MPGCPDHVNACLANGMGFRSSKKRDQFLFIN